VNLGRQVTLTATVKNPTKKGAVPSGAVTFLDGTTILGSRSLHHGQASLRTASLQVGANTIEVEYTPSSGFAPSSASIVETVRPPRTKGKPALSPGAVIRRTSAPDAKRIAGPAEISVASPAAGDATAFAPLPSDDGQLAVTGAIANKTHRDQSS
jgi:hypothetical protein